MLLKESLLPPLDFCRSLCESRGTFQLTLPDLLDVDLEGDGQSLNSQAKISTYGVGPLRRHRVSSVCTRMRMHIHQRYAVFLTARTSGQAACLD